MKSGEEIKKYSFKKGQKLRLDDIYDVQGVAGCDWYFADDEDVKIIKDIVIEIKITKGE